MAIFQRLNKAEAQSRKQRKDSIAFAAFQFRQLANKKLNIPVKLFNL